MRHFQAFLQQVRDLNELGSRFEAEVHYCRLDAVLNTLATLQETCTYRDLGKALGIFSARLAAMLGRRMQDDHANGEPHFSALIVNRATGRSSPGFFEKARSLGYVVENEEEFWKAQRIACYERFMDPAIVSMALETNLLDDERERVERLDNQIAAAIFDAGLRDRPFWCREIEGGRPVIRLRIGKWAALTLTPEEFAGLTDDALISKLRSRL